MLPDLRTIRPCGTDRRCILSASQGIRCRLKADTTRRQSEFMPKIMQAASGLARATVQASVTVRTRLSVLAGWRRRLLQEVGAPSFGCPSAPRRGNPHRPCYTGQRAIRARASAVSWLACGRRAPLHAGLLGAGFRAASASNSRKKPFSSKSAVSDASLKAKDPGLSSNPNPLVLVAVRIAFHARRPPRRAGAGSARRPACGD